MDKYDEEIAELRAANDPAVLYNHWLYWSPLFQAISPVQKRDTCGCLTQIRHSGHTSESSELTEMIRKDNRIPNEPLSLIEDSPDEVQARFDEIMPKLEVFAEYQRLADSKFGRV